MEMDWREIIRLSQKELKPNEKDKLCENLSWMEPDDIELNFSDLKTLFRLSQDILKYKTEQVNSLIGKSKRKVKTKERGTITDSPALSSDSTLETIAHQEEVIKANKKVLEQLCADIAELEQRKSKINIEQQDSDSSRNTLSEMNAVAHLENEISKRNRHIRKLLSDVKILEEENTSLKHNLTIFKEKLKESTLLIENLTEQLYTLNKSSAILKEHLGRSEQQRANLQIELENLKQNITDKDIKYERVEGDYLNKLQQLKNLLKRQTEEINRLSVENGGLKQNLTMNSEKIESPKNKKTLPEETKIKELQEKLSEASDQIIKSANLIKALTNENKHLKNLLDEIPEISLTEQKNESDDGKEKIMILKLNKKIKKLTNGLKFSEHMLIERERELTETAEQLQILKSDEGISTLIESINKKNKDLKLKGEGIKKLIIDVNNLNEIINELQLENETMREKLQIPPNEKVDTLEILNKFSDIEKNNKELMKKIRKHENKLISIEIDNHEKDTIISSLKAIIASGKNNEETCDNQKDSQSNILINENTMKTIDIQAIIEENEGLRNGLTEILSFIKDNSTSSSGILSVECPSLDAVLHSMDARKSAGWFSPHMKTVMELKAALGSKDALLCALHESRNEIFKIMTKLSEEKQKSSNLVQTLKEVNDDIKKDAEENVSNTSGVSVGEFGSWVLDTNYDSIDLNNENEIQNILLQNNVRFENQFKQIIQYFQNKFTVLFDKFTAITISAADNHNKWSIQEEHYKAEIENLKSQIEENLDDVSNLDSPGLISEKKSYFVHRKYIFLEESYKQMRTINENMKNEYLELKKETLNDSYEYEKKIQSLIQNIINLSDKMRNSVPFELLLKQSAILNNLGLRYRNILETKTRNSMYSDYLLRRLQENKCEILESIRKEMHVTSIEENKSIDEIISSSSNSILHKQLQQVCIDIDNKNIEIETLEKKILDLQTLQSEIIDKKLHSETSDNANFLKDQVHKLNEENIVLKKQCQNLGNKLDIVILELHTYKNNKLNNDKEINMLRHQILDLQSTCDSKATMARISGEVLVAQIQNSETQNKIESLKLALNKEKELRAETEEILLNRQKIFDIYTLRNNNTLRNLNEVLNILRQQYQGSLPLISLENFINKIKELQRKSDDFDKKIADVGDLQSTLMTKHSVYNQILDLSATNCLESEITCEHKIKNIMKEKTQSLEIEHYKRKIEAFENTHKELLNRCSLLEETIILVNQGLKNQSAILCPNEYDVQEKENFGLELLDIQSDDETNSRKSRTQTLSHPKINVKDIKNNKSMNEINEDLQSQTLITTMKKNQYTQTFSTKLDTKSIQTESNQSNDKLDSLINKLLMEKKQTDQIIEETIITTKQREQEILQLHNEKTEINAALLNLTESNKQKDDFNKKIQIVQESLKEEVTTLKSKHAKEIHKLNEKSNSENQDLLTEIKKIENDKNEMITEYRHLLNKERDDYASSLKNLQIKIKDMQLKLDERERDVQVTSNNDINKEANKKFSVKICDLEEKCFKLQSELDGYKSDFENQQGELGRWKNLASERLIKMEQLSAQLKERHTYEVESYKAENEHWLTQLKETQREHIELRSRLTEQKSLHLKQITEKDNQIEQLRIVVNNLKTQILNMQTMLTINDPSFDLSAIVEVDEVSDGVSQQGSDRLELKYESTVDLNETQEDFAKLPCSSTAIWQEPLLERLRREKQLMGKQNAILRRQIKVLAARERRSRLDAQNLRNQVFRISTTGNKVPSAESAALQSKIASLQAQLTSARRDAHSNVALWDKWKRSQQASERWQARYEEKCHEVKKLETNLNLSKSAVNRLEKEKRILLLRLGDERKEKQLAIEKQEVEVSEKASARSEQSFSPPPVSTRALLGRVEAQQRRIAALELAEMGNETLVSEYEKSLAEITSLKGQVLKLESTLLEAQIRSPLKSTSDPHPELQYWRNYCDMLKEENMQLTLKVNSVESAPTSANHQRVSDLEQTVLTLRGLVSKLQADNRSSSTSITRRVDSRPSSGRSGTDKVRSQIESYRIEISNLRRSISEKDALLEKSKDMLKIAAEREEELLRENMLLRRRIDQLTEGKEGFMSA